MKLKALLLLIAIGSVLVPAASAEAKDTYSVKICELLASGKVTCDETVQVPVSVPGKADSLVRYLGPPDATVYFYTSFNGGGVLLKYNNVTFGWQSCWDTGVNFGPWFDNQVSSLVSDCHVHMYDWSDAGGEREVMYPPYANMTYMNNRANSFSLRVSD